MCYHARLGDYDMVAFRSQHDSAGPGIFEQQFATTKYPATKVKLTPRDGVTPAWNEEIKNLLSQCRRTHILIEDGPPTLHRFLQEAPSIDLQLLRHMQAKAAHEWQRENTDVFYILRNSVNLDGPHNKADLAMLEQKFSFGDLRDGKDGCAVGLQSGLTTPVLNIAASHWVVMKADTPKFFVDYFFVLKIDLT